MAKKTKRRKKQGMAGPVLGTGGIITAFVFMPSTVMLFFAMLPTAAAALSDRIRGETRMLTVGAMNLAGCTPFLLDLWRNGHTLDNAFRIITDPRTIIVIYCAAAIGWLIDWAMSGIVATVMVQRGAGRLKDIKVKQAALVERWGKEVTGDYVLDSYGFPVDGAEPIMREDARAHDEDED